MKAQTIYLWKGQVYWHILQGEDMRNAPPLDISYSRIENCVFIMLEEYMAWHHVLLSYIYVLTRGPFYVNDEKQKQKKICIVLSTSCYTAQKAMKPSLYIKISNINSTTNRRHTNKSSTKRGKDNSRQTVTICEMDTDTDIPQQFLFVYLYWNVIISTDHPL